MEKRPTGPVMGQFDFTPTGLAPEWSDGRHHEMADSLATPLRLSPGSAAA
jgi:hypothetical protein